MVVMYSGRGRVVLDLYAQAADVDVHYLELALVVRAPDVLEYVLAGERLAGVFHKELHDGELRLCQLYALAVLVQSAVARVEEEGPADDLRLLRLLGRAHAAAERVHARYELRGRKRLGHIVVRAVHEPGDLVHLLAQRGEHDDAHLGAGRAYPAADFEAVYIRQHDVQQRHAYVRVGRERA